MSDVTCEQFKKRKLKIEKIDVSRWYPPKKKGDISWMYVKEISSAESQRMAKAKPAAGESDETDSGWVARCLCSKRGKRLLPDDYVIDHEETPIGLIRVIVDAALGINNISIEDAEKNSQSPADGSPSG